MGQLVKLDVAFRGEVNKGLAEYGFDVEDIVSPIRFDGDYSYFDARMIKGTVTANNNLAKVTYKVDHLLSDVAVMSDMFILLTVNKRKNVALDTPEQMIFVSSKISENIIPDGTGSMFYYAEDGDPLPVQYNVDEDIDEILAQATNHQLPTIVELTWVELRALRNTNTLVPGIFYKITDRADAGIIIQATSINTLTLHGTGLFMNPDFQDIGDYSGLTTPPATNRGVWSLASQAGSPFVNDDICFWNGLMYQVIDDSLFDTNSPDINVAAYQLITKSVTNGYILESDSIQYNFDLDTIIIRKDRRHNEVHNYVTDSAFSSLNTDNFQWGNPSVSNNLILNNADEAVYTSTVNQKGYFTDNKISLLIGNLIVDENFTGTIEHCLIEAFGDNILFTDSISYSGKTIVKDYSTFDKTLDMSSANVYAANVVSLTASGSVESNYVGIFTLNNNSGKTISKLTNVPNSLNYTIKVQAGNNQAFSHTAVGVAVADNMVSDSATVNSIFGRVNGSDFISYKKDGILNVRTNIVKLV